jgi:hypothetical protein
VGGGARVFELVDGQNEIDTVCVATLTLVTTFVTTPLTVLSFVMVAVLNNVVPLATMAVLTTVVPLTTVAVLSIVVPLTTVAVLNTVAVLSMVAVLTTSRVETEPEMLICVSVTVIGG